MTEKLNIRKISFAAVVAALYIALTLAGAMISYGPFQFRFSEILAVLPFFFPIAVPGLFVGCIIANLFSPYGILDVVVGSSASLLAGLCTMQIGKVLNRDNLKPKILACIPPVIINAVFIGGMISWLIVGETTSTVFLTTFLVYAGYVGLGQFGVLYLLGLPFLIYMSKSGLHQKLTAIINGNANRLFDTSQLK